MWICVYRKYVAIKLGPLAAAGRQFVLRRELDVVVLPHESLFRDDSRGLRRACSERHQEGGRQKCPALNDRLPFHALLTMYVVHPPYLFRLRLDVGHIEIDDYWLLAAAHDHARQRQVVARIDLLVRNVWRHVNVNEVARARVRYKFEPLGPSYPSSSAHEVYRKRLANPLLPQLC